jgi:hypothetical protein
MAISDEYTSLRYSRHLYNYFKQVAIIVNIINHHQRTLTIKHSIALINYVLLLAGMFINESQFHPHLTFLRKTTT